MPANETSKEIVQSDIYIADPRIDIRAPACPGPGTGFLWRAARDSCVQSHAYGWGKDCHPHFQVPLWHKGKSVFTIHGFESVRIVGTADLRD